MNISNVQTSLFPMACVKAFKKGLLFLLLLTVPFLAQSQCSDDADINPDTDVPNGITYDIVEDGAGNVTITITVIDNPPGLVGFLNMAPANMAIANGSGVLTWTLPTSAVNSPITIDLQWANGGAGTTDAIPWSPGDCAAAGPPPIAPGECPTLVNPGFEDGGGDADIGWLADSSLGDDPNDTSDFYADGNAAKLEDGDVIYQEVAVEPCTEYKLVFRYSIDDDDHQGSFTADILPGGGYTSPALVAAATPLGSFTGFLESGKKNYFVGTIPFNSGSNTTISIYMSNPTGDDVRIDEVEIVCPPPLDCDCDVTDLPVILCPSFEDGCRPKGGGSGNEMWENDSYDLSAGVSLFSGGSGNFNFGTQTAKFEDNGEYAYQEVNVEPNACYTIEYYYATDDGGVLQFDILPNGNYINPTTGTPLATVTHTDDTDEDYVQAEIEFCVTDECHVSLFFSNPGATDDSWVDDISFIAKTCAPEVACDCTSQSDTCTACGACETSLDYTMADQTATNFSGVFGGGTVMNPNYSTATNTGTLQLDAGAAATFAGFEIPVCLPDLVEGGCFTADIEILSGSFPIFYDMRIENGGGFANGLSWNGTINDFGTCSIGGDFAAGLVNGSFNFAPGSQYKLVIALVDFSGAPVTCDVMVEVSNVALSVCAGDDTAPELTCPSNTELLANGDFSGLDVASSFPTPAQFTDWTNTDGMNVYDDGGLSYPDKTTAKLFGFGGIEQSGIPISSDENWICFNGYFMNTSADPLNPGSYALMELFFFDAAGTQIGLEAIEEVGNAVPLPSNMWTKGGGCVEIPDGTATVTAKIIALTFNGGAVFLDDLSLTEVELISFCDIADAVITPPVASDDCNVASLTNDAPAAFPLGETFVTYTAIDDNGNESCCSVLVEVLGSPTAVCKNVITSLDPGETFILTPDMVDDGSFGFMPTDDIVLTVAPSVFTCANIGVNTVILTATDDCGNTGTCEASVTVDGAPFVCPANTVIGLEAGECEEIVFFTLEQDEACGVLETSTTFGGSFTTTGTPADATDNGTDISAQTDNGSTANYSWTVPACTSGALAVSFDWTYDNDESPFWDPFTLTGPGGTIASFTGFTGVTSEAGTACQAAVEGDVFNANLTSRDGVGAGGMYTLSNLQMVCASQAQVWDLEQTSGIDSGTYNPAGEYCIEYTATQFMLDGAVCDLIPTGIEAVCEFCITIEEYSGPVSSSLACNDEVTISADANCEALITADMVLEGGPYACYDNYVVETSFGSDLIVGCGTFQVTVTDPETGNSCWGTVIIEDKLPPVLEVLDYNVSCVEKYPTGALQQGSSGVMTAGGVVLGAGVSETFVFDNFSDCTVTDLDVYVSGSSTQMNALDIVIGFTPAGGGATITGDLFDFPGCGGQAWNGIDAIFDEECALNIALCTDINQAGGCIQPIGNAGVLSQFYGMAGAGQWTITIAEGGIGQIDEVTITLNGNDGSCNSEDVAVDDYETCDDATLTFTDWVDSDMCNGDVITRTWISTDKAGNTNMAVQTITVDPIGIGDLSLPPAVVELNSCGADTSPAAIAALFDNPLTRDDTTNGTSSCPPSGADECIEYNEGIKMAYPYYTINTGCGTDLHDQPVDNNVCNIYAVYSDSSIPACDENCGGAQKVIRTWTLIDWCAAEAGDANASVEYQQIIKVVDAEAPTMQVSDFTVSTDPWGCQASFIMPVPDLHDNCDGIIAYSVHGPAGVSVLQNPDTGLWETSGAPKSEMAADGSLIPWTFTYSATDCCGNVGVLDINVTVVDQAPPVAISTQNIVVSLTGSSTDADGFAKLYATSVDNGSFDGCTDVKLEVRRDSDPCDIRGNATYNDNFPFHSNDGVSNPSSGLYDPDNGEFVSFCCADAGTTVKVWLRVWDDGNMDGIVGGIGDNYNETWVDVVVEEKLPPVISCPADLEIECGWDWQTMSGPATAFDICGASETTLTIQDQTNECGLGRIRATYCTVPTGNESPVCCTQTITVIDSGSEFVADDVTYQRDQTLGCQSIPEAEQPQWGEGLCDLIGWSFEDEDFWFEDGACRKVLRTYSVINWCTEEETSHVTKFVVLDSNPPSLSGGVDMYAIDNTTDADEDCDAPIVLVQTAVDTLGDCASEWIEWKVEVDLWGDGTIDKTFSYAEGADEGFQEGRDNDEDGICYVAKTGNGEEVMVDLGDIAQSCSTHVVTWTANDGCNNITSRTQTFMVVDKKAPTPYCLSVSSAVMPSTGSVELWASDFDLGSSDLCGAVLISFSDTAYEPNKDFTCSDDADGDGIVNVPIYVWDSACPPNIGVCNVELTLSNCGTGGLKMIAGAVATEDGENVADVEVTLNSDDILNYTDTEMTDVNGQYAFDDNPELNDYAVTGEKDDDYMNGVSTLDLVLIQKHILGSQTLNSAYKMIAADINNSSNISAIDLVELRKLILGIYTELPNNDSWRMVDATQTLTVTNPWVFTEAINIQDLSSDMMNENFVGVKVGDVNNSVVANATSVTSENRSNGALTLEVMDRAVVAGETVKVDFMSSDYTDVYGYQFTMNFNGINVAGITAGANNVTEANISVTEKTMTMSYHNNVSGNVSVDDVLFTLEMTAVTSGNLSNMITVGSSITRAEAYVGESLEVVNVDLGIRTEGAVNIVEGFELYQNEPNPFKGMTQIGFNVPQALSATVTLYDVTGKVVKNITIDAVKGYNTVQLTRNDLGTSAGVLYYQLESGDFTATKKMIVID